ncbi:mannose-1-phosphate guanylyltransferase/mannose-6-phosphate isomerase [Cupriavidus metallidurans]|uniref:mannose-1-phosphate guanylyltransferase/mannose-6-phosphate isomerase n=1 Tax=Cupriavidus metallidurans TaxID=119219 RepID=UPI001BFC0850|nr:mannose-1-phosphate guanylyltransferase/mannose-6-phosphate isomerase [Cupriavidus metallidurans]QWC91620.1 mannose-1-phosphate guanylyltransferase/mannose-6-phosphate isomerase [Cupriavidus metallidurans]
MKSALIPVLLCGGAGSRLWPVSREASPKPFIRLPDGESLLQKAFLRGAHLPEVTEVLIATNREFFARTDEEISRVNQHGTRVSYLLEPVGRNTAAAIAAAAEHVRIVHGEDSVMLVLPADHLVDDLPALHDAVEEAVVLAEAGNLVTFGIRPDTPETGFGYIEHDGNIVRRFVEKPAKAQAVTYLESGRFLWNSGMFCFRAGSILAEMDRHCPGLISAVRACLNSADTQLIKTGTKVSLTETCFLQVPEDSIDYAVMEKSEHVAVVPCDIGWSDIGSWVALGNLVEPDDRGNRIDGNAMLHGSHNCYVQSTDRLVGMLGVDNLIVVDTPDAVLVASRDEAQSVKHLYNSLRKQGSDLYKQHRTVHRPWGTYTVLEGGAGFQIKRIEVKPGASLSLQMHHHRSEHWIVVSGTANVTNGERTMLVQKNESTYIPAGHQHRLENPGILNLVMIEVQVGEYLGEDDIVRFEDVYGRC